jgi:hypothetical protein
MSTICHFTVYGADHAAIESAARLVAANYFDTDSVVVDISVSENPDPRDRSYKDRYWIAEVRAQRFPDEEMSNP